MIWRLAERIRRAKAAAGLALVAAATLAAGPAAACLACITLPERTIADRLIEADVVALAREDPRRPFTYAPVRLLRGNSAPPIPLLVDSATRRRLEAAPSDAVLMAHSPEEGWMALAYAGPPVRRMAEAILAAATAWELDDGTARFAFFAERHDHPDPTIRQLALTELSAAPYSLIRTLRPRVSGDEIRQVLRDPMRTAWAPIHILFLGLSEDARDRRLVRNAVATAARHGIRSNLAAWATAYGEVDGLLAIARLRALYVDQKPRDPEALREIVIAFSTLAQGGDPALRPGIDAAFRSLAASGPPALAAEAARALTWAQDWSQVETFADLLASGTLSDPAAAFVISIYLEAAQEAAAPAEPPGNWRLEPR
ncbi:MAG TPA: hypothetical protein PKA33_00300 [Amaricoccus sp.]|uniref:hypothetical protein n=1 Tax=Amaricoccus sp. TaxID=1872485 RepID=UPI002B8D349A|nr:hypothetical protein [Amaricoccus sp.]HMQ92297.1 hypothetical protein [Amaricoccus sp.]HMR51036.1 hypothetical protein [Amaricoccus sp.]HMR61325.1 hypothetical protein [Amaricoccus sp.]HMT97785.1 hypothetical protein [Amaricoccus sp.]